MWVQKQRTGPLSLANKKGREEENPCQVAGWGPIYFQGKVKDQSSTPLWVQEADKGSLLFTEHTQKTPTVRLFSFKLHETAYARLEGDPWIQFIQLSNSGSFWPVIMVYNTSDHSHARGLNCLVGTWQPPHVIWQLRLDRDKGSGGVSVCSPRTQQALRETTAGTVKLFCKTIQTTLLQQNHASFIFKHI